MGRASCPVVTPPGPIYLHLYHQGQLCCVVQVRHRGKSAECFSWETGPPLLPLWPQGQLFHLLQAVRGSGSLLCFTHSTILPTRGRAVFSCPCSVFQDQLPRAAVSGSALLYTQGRCRAGSLFSVAAGKSRASSLACHEWRGVRALGHLPLALATTWPTKGTGPFLLLSWPLGRAPTSLTAAESALLCCPDEGQGQFFQSHSSGACSPFYCRKQGLKRARMASLLAMPPHHIWVVSGVSSPTLLPSQLAPLCPHQHHLLDCVAQVRCRNCSPECDSWWVTGSALRFSGSQSQMTHLPQVLRGQWRGRQGGWDQFFHFIPRGPAHLDPCQQGQFCWAAQVRFRTHSLQCYNDEWTAGLVLQIVGVGPTLCTPVL